MFDNEDGSWPELDFSEVSIARRLVRGGEGQYLVNKAPVRSTDLVELLADVGLGSAMHSIVGQGKVEQVLASKPEDRRAFVEEAAGLGKFKRRRHRAELKLARVALQVERARDVEEEVRKRLRPLALQATAAERAEKLVVEIASLARTSCRARRRRCGSTAAARSRFGAMLQRSARRGAQSRLEGLLTDRTRAEDELSDAAGRREAAVAALYRLQGGSERLELRSESAVDPPGPARTRACGSRAEAVGETRRQERARARSSRLGRCRPTRRGRARRSCRAGAPDGRAASLTRARSRGAGGPSPGGARACRTRRASCARSPGRRAGLRAGGRRGACAPVLPRFWRMIRAPRSSCSCELAPRALEASRSSRARSHKSSSRSSRSCPRRSFSPPPCRRSRRTGSATTPLGGSCGSRARPPRRFCSSSKPGVARSGRRRRSSGGARTKRQCGRRGDRSGRSRSGGSRRRSRPVARHDRSIASCSRASTNVPTSLADGLGAARQAAERFDAPLRARVDAGALRSASSATSSAARRRGGRTSAGARGGDGAGHDGRGRPRASGRRDPGGEQKARGCVGRARGGRRSRRARRPCRAARDPANGARSSEPTRARGVRHREGAADRPADPAPGSRAEPRRARASAGGPGRDRRAQVCGDLCVRRAELRGGCRDALPGRRGPAAARRARDEESEHGVEVELRPAGKRITRLSLLSGGEKALGAISFLFALFLARPCAFYLLDEVEAALDDTNIARFVELLRRYSDRAQFVVVTHQKRTMEAADVLYGVTMGPDGVSQVVSRRLPQREQAVAASAA